LGRQPLAMLEAITKLEEVLRSTKAKLVCSPAPQSTPEEKRKYLMMMKQKLNTTAASSSKLKHLKISSAQTAN